MSSARGIIKTYYAIGDTSFVPNNYITNVPPVSGDMSADITGPVTVLDRMDQVCIQIDWTSSDAIGVISIQGSVNGVDFYDLTFDDPIAQPASNDGGYLVNLALIPFTYLRVFYDRTSGSGDMNVYISCKGV